MPANWQDNPRYQMANKLRQRRGDVFGNGTPQIQADNPAAGFTAPRPIRATGSNFDPAYSQNLAVFGSQGGNIPQGGLTFNPTSSSPFQGVGNPIGGGNAPTYGMLPGALGNALNQPGVFNNMSPVGSPYFTPGGVQGLGV